MAALTERGSGRSTTEAERNIRLPQSPCRTQGAVGIHCNRKRVARLMRKDGLRGCMRGRRRKHTTRQDPLLAIPAPDLLVWAGTSSVPPHPIDCGRRILHRYYIDI